MSSFSYVIRILLLSVFFIGACKKTKKNIVVPQYGNRIKTKTVTFPSSASNPNPTPTTDYYSYDYLGRIIKDSSSAPYWGNITYTYYPDSVVMYSYYHDGSFQLSETFYLNAQSTADSAIVLERVYKTFYKYSYDANSFCITWAYTETQGSRFGEVDNTVNGENITSTVSTDGISTSTTNFTYDTSHTNTLGYDNYGQSFYGSSSKNVLMSDVPVPIDVFSDIETYQYTYDAAGRITTKKTLDNSSVASTETFTYY